MRTWRHTLCHALCAALCLGGCATYSPLLVELERGGAGVTGDESPVTPAPPLSLSAPEARPNGLLLSLKAHPELPQRAWTRLELLRARDDEQGVILQTIQVSSEHLEALTTQGLSILDQDVSAGSTYAYQWRLVEADAEPLIASPVIRIPWERVPDMPGSPAGIALDDHVVEITWEQLEGWGGVVFRRDVLDQSAGLERVAELERAGSARFVDHRVRPARIYAYRVAYMQRRAGELKAYGMASGEFYVKTPAR